MHLANVLTSHVISPNDHYYIGLVVELREGTDKMHYISCQLRHLIGL